jgi:hypothetical protein
MQNSLNKNYPLKNTKDKSKKMAYNKFEEKGNKKRKENKNRKKLALLGLNKPNSSRNPQIFNLNLASNIDINIDINNINNNNLIKSSDISININKKETNKKNKIQIFRIDKVPKNPNEKENQNLIKKEKEKPDYLYLNFNFQNSQENISYVGEYLEEIYVNLLLEETQATTKPKFGYMNTQP